MCSLCSYENPLWYNIYGCKSIRIQRGCAHKKSQHYSQTTADIYSDPDITLAACLLDDGRPRHNASAHTTYAFIYLCDNIQIFASIC